MEEWIFLAISLTTLIYVLFVAGLAYKLKRTPRPYPSAWLKRYLRSIERMRSSLWVSFFLLGTNALVFFVPSFMGGSQGRFATLSGGLDLICAIVLYGVWRWAGHL